MASPEPHVIEVFAPSPGQWAIHQQRQRFSVLVCHRGFGKTVLAVNELMLAAGQTPEGRYAYIAPFRNQAKQNAWDDVLKKFMRPIPGSEFNESELKCTLENGARIQLFGADNADALRGMHLDGVVLDEVAQIPTSAWAEIVRPALERKQGFAMFIGTPKGKNHFYKLYEYARSSPDWYADMWPASRSAVFDAAQLDKIKGQVGPDYYAQEYECSWEAAIKGAYYARQLETARAEGRIRLVPWEPTVPVETWWDLGWSDATAIIIGQRMGREIHLIDYLESYGEPLAWYAKELTRRPYIYRTHYLPHDAAKHELGSGKTLDEQLRLVGIGPTRVLAPNEPMDGINQARLIFPRVWFDESKCARLIDMLGRYRADWDDAKDDYRQKPLHDVASHAADAFRYMAISLTDLHARPVDAPKRERNNGNFSLRSVTGGAWR